MRMNIHVLVITMIIYNTWMAATCLATSRAPDDIDGDEAEDEGEEEDAEDADAEDEEAEDEDAVEADVDADADRDL